MCPLRSQVENSLEMTETVLLLVKIVQSERQATTAEPDRVSSYYSTLGLDFPEPSPILGETSGAPARLQREVLAKAAIRR